MGLVDAASFAELTARKRLLVRAEGRQIALFLDDRDRVLACANRCPHEGYPLAEGSLDGCVLTCNWHNWKFDLNDGAALVGEDSVRIYPVRVEGGRVLLDLTDPPAEERRKAALRGLRAAFRRNARDAMARQAARFLAADGSREGLLDAALGWALPCLEYGTTHAVAAAPDWLALAADPRASSAERLVPLVELLSHLATDSLREPVYPYAEGRVALFDPAALLAAIEREDEAGAVAQARAGVAERRDLLPVLAEAALAHYADFGHAVIYVAKTFELIEQVPGQRESLLLALVRALVFATREDLIPEFRGYGQTLAAWAQTTREQGGDEPVEAGDFVGLTVKAALARCLRSAQRPDELYRALLGASAWNLLHFDERLQARTAIPVSENVGWLDFTHAVTFANAARRLCAVRSDLWPRALLQLACFVGRNAGWVDARQSALAWHVADAEAWAADSARRLFDHDAVEPIVSAHLVKTLTAAVEEAGLLPAGRARDLLLAGVNRFLHSPVPRRHALREATQALAIVTAEG